MKYFLDFFITRLKTDKSIPIIFLVMFLITLIMGTMGPKTTPSIFLNTLIWMLWIFVTGIFITLGTTYLTYKNKLKIINMIILKTIALLVLLVLIWLFIDINLTVLLRIVFSFTAIATTLITIYYFLSKNTNDYECAIMQHIPIPKRGHLWALQAQDHYVNIITSKGNHLVLITFKEAIKQTQPIAGEQVNRSYWVAKDGLSDIIKKNGKNICVLKNDTEISISKNHLTKIKKKKWIK